VDVPGRAEEQAEGHEAPRLEEQERGAEDEEVEAEAPGRDTRVARASGDEDERENEEQRERDDELRLHARVAQVRQRPVVRRRTGSRGDRGRAWPRPPRRRWVDGRHGLPARDDDRRHGVSREGTDEGRSAEDVIEHPRIPVDEPLLAVVVVEDEDATGREMVARRRERLLREEERLQTPVRRGRDEGEGVGLREDDEVESVGRAAKEVATV